MKAIALHDRNDLRVDDIEAPVPGANEVRVRVVTAGVNFTDLHLRDGRLPGPPLPFVLGAEIAGVVDALGGDVREVAVGERVTATLPKLGGFAELAVAPVSNVVPIPPGVTFDAAVTLPAAAPTAVMLLRGASAGETVFVPSAAGGVGSLVVALAKHRGLRVVAGTSTNEGRAFVQQLGADVVVDTSRNDWPDEVRRATERGADIVLSRDPDLAPSLRALAARGRLVVFGVDNMLGSSLPSAQMGALLAQNQSLVGVATFTLPPDEVRSALCEIFALIESGTIPPRVGATFPLDEVPRALDALAERRTVGKVVIVVAPR